MGDQGGGEDGAATGETPSADTGDGTGSDDAGAAETAAANQAESPGAAAMRRLLEQADDSGAGGSGDGAPGGVVQRRLAELSQAVKGLESRVAAMEPAVQRWTEMESQLEDLVAALRENAAGRRQAFEAPVPARPPASQVMRDPTEPPRDPALRANRGRGGDGESDATGGGPGSPTDPSEIDKAGLHLVSYENPDNAGPGWQSLKQRYSEQLGDLQRRMATVTLPDGRTFHRLVAGPIDSVEAAQQRCQQLEEQGQYCALTSFVGSPG